MQMTEQISEVYNIHYLHMDESRWEALGRVYEQLPEFIGYSDGCPYWFGLEQDAVEGEADISAKRLWATVEPSGLLVEGCLSPSDWAHWQEAFLPLASAAVEFTVKPAKDDTEWPYAPLK